MTRFLPATILPLFCGGALLLAQDDTPPPPPVPDAVTGEAPALEVSTEADRPVRRSRRSQRPTRELVTVGSDAHVKEGEEFGDVVVVRGNARIDGTVRGDLVTVLGKVQLGPKAVVNGDLTVVAGTLDTDPAAIIKGSPTVIGWDFVGLHRAFERHAWWVRLPGEWAQQGLSKRRILPHQFPWSWGLAGLGLLGCLIVALVFPRSVQASVGMLRASPLRALAAGLLALVALLPLTFLLLLTGIGVLVIPLLIAGTLVAFLFGEVAVFGGTGQSIGSVLGAKVLQKPLLSVLAGGVLFTLLYTIPFIGLAAWFAALVLGFGAVLLALFKREPKPAASFATGIATAVPGSPLAMSEPPALGAAMMPRVGFWPRFVATLLDAVLIGLIVGPLLHAPKWFLLLWVIYHIGMWAWRGTTIGGIVLGLRIVRVDGQSINFAVAVVRALASFFSAAVLGLGFLWAGWTRDKQSWHDKIAGTVVVKPPKGTSLV